ncbi:hypothetical protein J4G33_16410 [Actinotalea sp. BY-33]|uniref:Subtilisin inhibitor domain-containing protein n=1 Tax=Actinotalea soli TaxID=2819234 RepID=A0A939LT42_9CELL|nr:SSI family serine proteinase inhibitor [Actinotalea soli]MBO1753393.1 hypothetical protein [Actinotalea soli]
MQSPRRPRRTRPALGARAGATAVLLAALAVTGCASPGQPGAPAEDDGAASGPAPEETAAAEGTTDLTITVDPTGEGASSTYTLTCDPAGGDHPDPEAACALLEEVGVEAFAPVPRDASCTQQYGGPQTATVEGTLGGEQIDARFAYTDGCEISRWDGVADLLPADAGLL